MSGNQGHGDYSQTQTFYNASQNYGPPSHGQGHQYQHGKRGWQQAGGNILPQQPGMQPITPPGMHMARGRGLPQQPGMQPITPPGMHMARGRGASLEGPAPSVNNPQGQEFRQPNNPPPQRQGYQDDYHQGQGNGRARSQERRGRHDSHRSQSGDRRGYRQSPNRSYESSPQSSWHRGQHPETPGSSPRKGRNDDSTVFLSKTLSSILRHNAENFGLKLMKGGYLYVDEILRKVHKLRSYTLEDMQYVVQSNDKQRFAMEQEDNGRWKIRANQGHSIQVEELDLQPIKSADEISVVIHGTYFTNWDIIQKTGLRRMNRNHIHFAAGLPGLGGVISGMRTSCEVIIYLNLKKALEDGIPFFRSANNVILSPGNKDGIIYPCYFEGVMDRGKACRIQFNDKISSGIREEPADSVGGKKRKNKKKKDKEQKGEGTDSDDSPSPKKCKIALPVQKDSHVHLVPPPRKPKIRVQLGSTRFDSPKLTESYSASKSCYSPKGQGKKDEKKNDRNTVGSWQKHVPLVDEW